MKLHVCTDAVLERQHQPTTDTWLPAVPTWVYNSQQYGRGLDKNAALQQALCSAALQASDASRARIKGHGQLRHEESSRMQIEI
ncbi:hypothetical protein E4U13_003916 [Claviceps humidiphila]|uniref:Uncharacterized protein n=1 Tax=Claviceps humidiphila TaxID=1294629 RepID=A0A9P7PZB5_9HYPO|nr:hypothetical protein E4U13_003916 [Claviceps humidiphila]